MGGGSFPLLLVYFNNFAVCVRIFRLSLANKFRGY
ncbi:MAG: hypothetical protein BWY11_01731 [Firmicutes bacterium ADurb.Bin182]|nr:MAG: hypothetical protein BWY11_01731 [Firmicutes bacterium ADurb.Bin182]